MCWMRASSRCRWAWWGSYTSAGGGWGGGVWGGRARPRRGVWPARVGGGAGKQWGGGGADRTADGQHGDICAGCAGAAGAGGRGGGAIHGGAGLGAGILGAAGPDGGGVCAGPARGGGRAAVPHGRPRAV